MRNQEQDEYSYIREYFQLWHEIDSLYDVYAKAAGMTCNTLFVLHIIYMHQDNCTQKYIAEKAKMTKPTVNVIITGFIEQGLVTLTESPADRRTKLITLTESGRAYTEKLIPGMMNAEREAMDKLGDELRGQLINSTRLYYENFKQAIEDAIEDNMGKPV